MLVVPAVVVSVLVVPCIRRHHRSSCCYSSCGFVASLPPSRIRSSYATGRWVHTLVAKKPTHHIVAYRVTRKNGTYANNKQNDDRAQPTGPNGRAIVRICLVSSVEREFVSRFFCPFSLAMSRCLLSRISGNGEFWTSYQHAKRLRRQSSAASRRPMPNRTFCSTSPAQEYKYVSTKSVHSTAFRARSP